MNFIDFEGGISNINVDWFHRNSFAFAFVNLLRNCTYFEKLSCQNIWDKV